MYPFGIITPILMKNSEYSECVLDYFIKKVGI